MKSFKVFMLTLAWMLSFSNIPANARIPVTVKLGASAIAAFLGYHEIMLDITKRKLAELEKIRLPNNTRRGYEDAYFRELFKCESAKTLHEHFSVTRKIRDLKAQGLFKKSKPKIVVIPNSGSK